MFFGGFTDADSSFVMPGEQRLCPLLEMKCADSKPPNHKTFRANTDNPITTEKQHFTTAVRSRYEAKHINLHNIHLVSDVSLEITHKKRRETHKESGGA